MAAPGAMPGIAALRLDLTNHGVRIEQPLIDAGFTLLLSLEEGREGLAEGIDLILPGGYWTNVSVAATFARRSRWRLGFAEGDSERLVLRRKGQAEVTVSVPDTSRFRQHRLGNGLSCGEVGAVHGAWVVIAPFVAREQTGLDRPRRFLGLRPTRPLSKGQWSVDEVVTCAETAWRAAAVRMVHLEASHLLRPDGGVGDLAPYLVALKRALPVLISVSVLPPEDPAAVLALYAQGADAVSYHLLAWDDEAVSRISPLRGRFVPRARTLAALEAAAGFFPKGAVSTDLLVGLEPLAAASTACQWLIERHIVPNLAPFRPLPGAEDQAPMGEVVPQEGMLALMEERGRLMRARGLASSRVRGFPRVLSGMDRFEPRILDRAYAHWRRALRVVTA